MILKNFTRIIKTTIFQFIATIFLLSFLFFFLTILAGLTIKVADFSHDLKDKLGIYIYFRDGKDTQDSESIFTEIINLENELKSKNLNVQFSNKEEGIKVLSKRFPEIIDNFKKYGLDNPIPHTMYIVFDDEKGYNDMKTILSKPQYKDIVQNLDELGITNSFREQEQRVANTIEFTNFIIKFYIFLSIILVVIIIWFILLLLKLNFFNFYKQLEVEKLIWTFYWQIKIPFVLEALLLVVIAFFINIVYTFFLLRYLNVYFLKVFDYNIFEIVQYNQVIVDGLTVSNIILLELWFFVAIVLIASDLFLSWLIRKI